MTKQLQRITLIFCLVAPGHTFAFPDTSDLRPDALAAEAQTAAYNFEGIVALSNCSGSIVRFDDSRGSDPAMVLSNGHCVALLDPGAAIVKRRDDRSFEVLDRHGETLGTVTAEAILHATKKVPAWAARRRRAATPQARQNPSTSMSTWRLVRSRVQAAGSRSGQQRSEPAGFVELKVRHEECPTAAQKPAGCEVMARCGLTLRLPSGLSDKESLRMMRLLAEVDRC